MVSKKNGLPPNSSYTTIDYISRKDHILRKINIHVNFDFIYKEVEASYGEK